MTGPEDYELVELRRQDKPDIAFEGRLLAFADNKDEAEANPRKSALRWTALSVYELRDGSWVAVTEAISDKPGEVDFGTAIKLAADDVTGAMEFFGWTWLAKKLATDAGWDVVERFDVPRDGSTTLNLRVTTTQFGAERELFRQPPLSRE